MFGYVLKSGLTLEVDYIAIMYVKGPLLKKYFLLTKVFEIHSGQEFPLKIYLARGDIISSLIMYYKLNFKKFIRVDIQYYVSFRYITK